MLGNLRQLAFEDFFIKSLHVLSLEWGFESDHLIDDAAEGPYIRLDIIRFILPNLGTSVVRSSRLRIV
jgi:hypothetical protein